MRQLFLIIFGQITANNPNILRILLIFPIGALNIKSISMIFLAGDDRLSYPLSYINSGGCPPVSRNILLADKLQPSITEITTTQPRLEYPVSDRAVTLGYRPRNSQLQQIGKKATRLYKERHGTKPIQREQFVAGATRMVNVYGFNDLDLLDQAIALVMDK